MDRPLEFCDPAKSVRELMDALTALGLLLETAERFSITRSDRSEISLLLEAASAQYARARTAVHALRPFLGSAA